MAKQEPPKDAKEIEKKVDEIMDSHKARALTDEEHRAMLQRLRDQYGSS